MNELKEEAPDGAKGTLIETEWFKNLVDVEESDKPTELATYMETLFNIKCIDYEQLFEA